MHTRPLTSTDAFFALGAADVLLFRNHKGVLRGFGLPRAVSPLGPSPHPVLQVELHPHQGRLQEEKDAHR